ncbi:hypothetical protein GCM10010344_67510 [Streptomyces bluensis]|nr:hypothetical protein GCM10010344_67510 [Streptomyces bluensis]
MGRPTGERPTRRLRCPHVRREVWSAATWACPEPLTNLFRFRRRQSVPRTARLIIMHPNDQVRSAMWKIGLTRARARPHARRG